MDTDSLVISDTKDDKTKAPSHNPLIWDVKEPTNYS